MPKALSKSVRFTGYDFFDENEEDTEGAQDDCTEGKHKKLEPINLSFQQKILVMESILPHAPKLFGKLKANWTNAMRKEKYKAIIQELKVKGIRVPYDDPDYFRRYPFILITNILFYKYKMLSAMILMLTSFTVPDESSTTSNGRPRRS